MWMRATTAVHSARVAGGADLSEAGLGRMIRPESPDSGALSWLCLQTRLGTSGEPEGLGQSTKVLSGLAIFCSGCRDQ